VAHKDGPSRHGSDAAAWRLVGGLPRPYDIYESACGPARM